MNFKNPNITQNRNLLLIGGAILLCVIIATGVFFGLRKVAPRSSDLAGQTPTNGSNTPATPEQLVSQADTAFKAADNALKAGKTEEAIEQLNTAKKLYQEAGEVTKVEQTTDVINQTEHEAKVETQHGQGGSDQEDAGSDGTGDLNGDGIIGEGEQAPPQYETIAGDKATREPAQP